MRQAFKSKSITPVLDERDSLNLQLPASRHRLSRVETESRAEVLALGATRPCKKFNRVKRMSPRFCILANQAGLEALTIVHWFPPA